MDQVAAAASKVNITEKSTMCLDSTVALFSSQSPLSSLVRVEFEVELGGSGASAGQDHKGKLST